MTWNQITSGWHLVWFWFYGGGRSCSQTGSSSSPCFSAIQWFSNLFKHPPLWRWGIFTVSATYLILTLPDHDTCPLTPCGSSARQGKVRMILRALTLTGPQRTISYSNQCLGGLKISICYKAQTPGPLSPGFGGGLIFRSPLCAFVWIWVHNHHCTCKSRKALLPFILYEGTQENVLLFLAPPLVMSLVSTLGEPLVRSKQIDLDWPCVQTTDLYTSNRQSVRRDKSEWRRSREECVEVSTVCRRSYRTMSFCS